MLIVFSGLRKISYLLLFKDKSIDSTLDMFSLTVLPLRCWLKSDDNSDCFTNLFIRSLSLRNGIKF